MILPRHKKLVTAGCSFTFGQGLSNPKTQSWPAVLANKLGLECVNLGHCGASNEFITNTVIKHFLINDPGDCFLIIAYSGIERMSFGYHNDDEQLVHLTPNSRIFKKLSDTIYPEFTNQVYATRKLLLDMMRTQAWLEKKDISYAMVNGFATLSIEDQETRWYYNQLNQKNLINFTTITFNVIVKDEKLFDGHPNEIGHQRIANKLYENLQVKNILS